MRSETASSQKIKVRLFCKFSKITLDFAQIIRYCLSCPKRVGQTFILKIVPTAREIKEMKSLKRR